MMPAEATVTAPQADVTTLRSFLNQHEGRYRQVVEDEEHIFCPGHLTDEALSSGEARALFDEATLDTPILVLYHGGPITCHRSALPGEFRPDLPRSLHQLVATQPYEAFHDWTPVLSALPAVLWFEPVIQQD